MKPYLLLSDDQTFAFSAENPTGAEAHGEATAQSFPRPSGSGPVKRLRWPMLQDPA